MGREDDRRADLQLWTTLYAASSTGTDREEDTTARHRIADELERDFVDRLNKHLAELGDDGTRLAVEHYFASAPERMDNIVTALRNGRKIDTLVDTAVEFSLGILKRENLQDRRCAEKEARRAAEDFGFDERQARYIGLKAARLGQSLREEALQASIENYNALPGAVGLVVAAKAYMGAGGETVTAYEAYDAIVASQESPGGLVPEIEVIRTLQEIESGQDVKFQSETMELAVRLRQALDKGIDPDTEVSVAMGMPESVMQSPVSPEKALEFSTRSERNLANKSDNAAPPRSVTPAIPSP